MVKFGEKKQGGVRRVAVSIKDSGRVNETKEFQSPEG